VVRRIGWAVVIVVVVLVVVLVAGAVTVVRVQSRPEVDTASLLLSGDASPRVTDPGRWVAEHDDVTTMGPGVAHHQITRSWTAGERDPALTQMVLRYDGVPSAIWYYVVDDPAREYRSERGGGEEVDAGGAARHADAHKLFCGNSDPEQCGTWVYWARYGQYAVRLYYVQRVSEPLSLEEFRGYVSTVDRVMADRLG
jgi:hypothetical protein